MKTTKPISTISFNTIHYLQLKLNELFKSHIISFYAFIRHFPEDDEGGKKEHYHVFIEPAKSIQTEELREIFYEFDPSYPEKPLGVLAFKSSKFDDWYMYSIHDKTYLASKGESRVYEYTFNDVFSSEDDDLLYRVKTINSLNLTPYKRILTAIESGISFHEFFYSGCIPIQQIRYYQEAWALMEESRTKRAEHLAHDMDVDILTGELKNTLSPLPKAQSSQAIQEPIKELDK